MHGTITDESLAKIINLTVLTINHNDKTNDSA